MTLDIPTAPLILNVYHIIEDSYTQHNVCNSTPKSFPTSLKFEAARAYKRSHKHLPQHFNFKKEVGIFVEAISDVAKISARYKSGSAEAPSAESK